MQLKGAADFLSIINYARSKSQIPSTSSFFYFSASGHNFYNPVGSNY